MTPMHIDIREFILQLRALVRICFLHPNSWREIAMGAIAIVLAPLVVFICLLANTKSRP